jgi:hypothetical protein
MSSKIKLDLLLGRRIVGGIVKKGEGPKSQLFLILDDGTWTELTSDGSIWMSGGWRGDAAWVRKYIASSHKITDEAHLEEVRPQSKTDKPPAPPETKYEDFPPRNDEWEGRIPAGLPPAMTDEEFENFPAPKGEWTPPDHPIPLEQIPPGMTEEEFYKRALISRLGLSPAVSKKETERRQLTMMRFGLECHRGED